MKIAEIHKIGWGFLCLGTLTEQISNLTLTKCLQSCKGIFKKGFEQNLVIRFTLQGDVQGMIRVTGRLLMVSGRHSRKENREEEGNAF